MLVKNSVFSTRLSTINPNRVCVDKVVKKEYINPFTNETTIRTSNEGISVLKEDITKLVLILMQTQEVLEKSKV